MTDKKPDVIQKKPKAPLSLPRRWYLRILINILITLIVGAAIFYFMLPAINVHSMDFYFYVGSLCIVYLIVAWINSDAVQGISFLPTSRPNKKDKSASQGSSTAFFDRQLGTVVGIVILLIVVAVAGSIGSSVIFRANSYNKLISVKNGKFETDVQEVDFSSVPMIDLESAKKLGDRKLGELEDMVSQFSVDEYYTQINYKNTPVRVTPLKYSDIIKWFINRADGLPAYLIVDMVSQAVDIVRLDEGIKYSTCEYFNRNLTRHLRFNYPAYMFDTPVFEIDEQGNPYWVCPRVDKTIGLFGGTDIVGAVLVNAVTGECSYYSTKTLAEDPSLAWIDRVYSADLLVDQYDYFGKYQSGFLNSIFGQRGVKVTTEGYNYLALNDDVYLYTGVTSVTDDQSIIRFVLVNQRTKEANYYSIAGAKENSARSSAQGVVQQFGYNATFPLLLNISGQPTYFMALKDTSNLVKQYAMVNVEQYQIVATGVSLAECSQNYAALLREKGIIVDAAEQDPAAEDSTQELLSVTGKISDIRTAVIGGNSMYYIKLQNNPAYYSIKALDWEITVILNTGDNVVIKYKKETPGIIPAAEISPATQE
ncbi:MAG: CvpA family protein [Oscillospiraceae bacterium]|nr:CvpA family protein [Oscillospiraceae bacterium]